MRRAMLSITGRVLVVALMLCVMAVLAFSCILYTRYRQQGLGKGAVDAPALPHAPAMPLADRFEASLRLTDLLAPPGEEIAVDVMWDDSWFTADPAIYRPELAHVCSVLAALAYSESGYYQKQGNHEPYMELALAGLGFHDVSTASYRYRSEVVDQALSLLTRRSDTAAYAIADKTLLNREGDAVATLIMVSVRGSYGAEWLSNLEVLFERGADAADSAAAPVECGMHASGDHPGYTAAADEILAEISQRVRVAHHAGLPAKLLLVGHSRGGAIANLVAARACEALGDPARDGSVPLEEGDGVFAYTFAAPGATADAARRAPCYGSIFNVVNPADLMTHLPLEEWGYGRYGVDVTLPSIDDGGAAEAYDRMGGAFERLVGTTCPVDSDTEHMVRGITEDLAARLGSIDEAATPAGAAQAISVMMEHGDPASMFAGHHPSVYIAWMQTMTSWGSQ